MNNRDLNKMTFKHYHRLVRIERQYGSNKMRDAYAYDRDGFVAFLQSGLRDDGPSRLLVRQCLDAKEPQAYPTDYKTIKALRELLAIAQ